MLPFGVTIPATVSQGSEIPEGLTNNPVYIYIYIFFTEMILWLFYRLKQVAMQEGQFVLAVKTCVLMDCCYCCCFVVLVLWLMNNPVYNGPTNALVCIKTLIQMSHTKTFKITPTCFDHVNLQVWLCSCITTLEDSPHILTSDFNQDHKAPWWWSSDDRNLYIGLSIVNYRVSSDFCANLCA
jgi:hypothetical protein